MVERNTQIHRNNNSSQNSRDTIEGNKSLRTFYPRLMVLQHLAHIPDTGQNFHMKTECLGGNGYYKEVDGTPTRFHGLVND